MKPHGLAFGWAVCWAALFALPTAAPAIAANNPLLYPPPANGQFMRAPNVRVKIDGQPTFVYGLMKVGTTYGGISTVASDFTSFAWHGEAVDVSVDYTAIPVNDARVRRLGAEIPVRRAGNQISFRIDKPGAYEIEVNHDLRGRGPVVIFANAPDNWNTRPDDITFPPGRVTDAGVIRVTKDNQRIYIPGGAVVRALIKVEGASNVKIGGNGVLLFDDKAAEDFKSESDTSPILATDTDGLTVSGLTVVVAPTSFASGPDNTPVAPWAVHILRSTNTQITDLNILNQLRDGLDVDGSEHVTVRGGFMQAHDDVICIKSTNYGPGNGAHDQPVKDVTFSNLMVMNMGTGNALSIGKELHTSEIAHIVYRNIDILHAIGPHGTAIGINNGDRADVHDIIFDNVLVNDTPGTLLRFSIEKDGYRPDPDRGRIDNIVLRGLRVAKGISAPSQIVGIDARHTVSDVLFENFRHDGNSQVSPKLEIEIENAPAPLWLQTRQNPTQP